MTSKASLSKKLLHKGLFFSDLKRFWWVSTLYTIALILMLPVYHLLQSTSEENTWAWDGLKSALTLSTGYSELQIILIYLVPVFLAVLLFMYLHSSRATANIHSLPISRKQLFFTHGAAGILLLTIPVIITGLALIAVQQMTLLKDIYSVGAILSWMGYTLLFNILFFALAVFVGMFTGTPITQAVFTYILIILPVGLCELFRYNFSQLLFGYSNISLHQSFIDSLPIYALISDFVGEGLFTTGYVVSTLIFILVTFVLALYAYQARNSEAAGDVIAFSIIRPIFKYGVTICTMLLVGAYFASVSKDSLSAVIFGYLFGSFLGYFIAEILLQKSLKIWRQSYKGYLAYALLLVLALFAVQGDVFGFVKRVPAPEEIEEVFFGYNLHSWVAMNNRVDNEITAESEYYYFQSGQSGIWTFKSPQNIKNIVNLHKKIVQEKAPEGNLTQFMVYSLKGGKQIVRQYNINGKDFTDLLKPIYESTEYKEARYNVFNQASNEIKMIEINDSRTPKEPMILADNAEINQLMEVLRQDLKSLHFEEMNFWKNNGLVLSIRDMQDRRIDYTIGDSYSSTLQWLSDKGYLEKTVLQSKEIEYAELDASQREAREAPLKIKITDAELINELLEKSGRSNYLETGEEIYIYFHVKNNYGTYQFQESIWKDASVSPELKQYLDKVI